MNKTQTNRNRLRDTETKVLVTQRRKVRGWMGKNQTSTEKSLRATVPVPFLEEEEPGLCTGRGREEGPGGKQGPGHWGRQRPLRWEGAFISQGPKEPGPSQTRRAPSRPGGGLVPSLCRRSHFPPKTSSVAKTAAGLPVSAFHLESGPVSTWRARRAGQEFGQGAGAPKGKSCPRAPR